MSTLVFRFKKQAKATVKGAKKQSAWARKTWYLDQQLLKAIIDFNHWISFFVCLLFWQGPTDRLFEMLILQSVSWVCLCSRTSKIKSPKSNKPRTRDTGSQLILHISNLSDKVVKLTARNNRGSQTPWVCVSYLWRMSKAAAGGI